MEAGLATPALAERSGGWAADPTQRQVLAMLRKDHGVQGSCTTLRTLLGSLSAGMAPHRPPAQVEQVVRWLHQARASQGRFQPTLSVGRDGVNVSMRHGDWQEGTTATGAVLERGGKRVGTVDLGQMPEAGQPTLTAPLTALLQDILRRVDSQSRRLVSGSDDGYHPSHDSHHVLQKRQDPKRPWHTREWIRLVDSYHACLYLKQLAEALCGSGPKGQAWAKQMRKYLKTKSNGITRVLQSASALRRQHGRWGQAKDYDQAYASLHKRTPWMRSRPSSSQRLPSGSGMTEAACKMVFPQRLKRSGRSWTISGGQVMLDWRVIWLSGVWNEVHWRY